MVTIEEARIVAQKIKQGSPKVKSVELFGSVKRNGQGRDFDLLLIVDDELSRKFWSTIKDLHFKWRPLPLPLRRFTKTFLPFLDQIFWKKNLIHQDRASDLIDLDLSLLAKEHSGGVPIDAWLMPDNWRSKITEISDNPNMHKVFKTIAAYAEKVA